MPSSSITASEINRKRAAELEALFSKRLAEAGLPFEWRAVESFSGDSALAARAERAHAPIWSSPSEARSGRSRPERRPRRAALRSRPAGAAGAACRRCAEGPSARCWSPGTARARRRAPPSTRCPSSWRPTRPSVVTIDAGDDPERTPGSRLAAALARHGAHVIGRRELSSQRPPGRRRASPTMSTLSGADLLVMGAYGHSRLREFLFGGVTRSVLRSMPVATFMSR